VEEESAYQYFRKQGVLPKVREWLEKNPPPKGLFPCKGFEHQRHFFIVAGDLSPLFEGGDV